MRRKLLFLNLVLVGLIGAAGWQLRLDWKSARVREKAFRNSTVKAAQTLEHPIAELPSAKPASDYIDIAQELLFSPDRNPDVVVEVAKPKPMPPLPKYYGAMDFGDGPTVILSGAKSERQRGYRLGDKVGEFKLVSIDQEEITFDWDGQPVTAKLSELRPKQVARAKTSASSDAARAPAPSKPTAVKRVAPVAQGHPAPSETGTNVRACVDGDNSPNGTVADGFRKEVYKTPFSNVCRWRKVGQ